MGNKFYLVMTVIHIIFWIAMYQFRDKKSKKQRKIDAFDPFYLITGLYFMVFVIAPWIWIDRGQTSYQGIAVIKYLPEATLVFNIGYFAYCFGCMFYKEKTLAKVESEDYLRYLNAPKTRSFIVTYAVIVFFVSLVLALSYYILTGRGIVFMLTLGQGQEMQVGRDGLGIYFLAQFIRSAIPGLLLLLAFAKKYRILLIPAAYVICAVCISTGSRNLAICVVLAILVTLYMRKDKRPSFLLVLVGVVAMYLFVGFVGVFRQAMKTGGEIDISLITADSLFDAFMFNIEIFYPFYTLIGYTMKGMMGCHYGLGVLNIPIQFIPRAIWPNKPATFGKTAFEAMYGDSMGGAAYPNIGEFYYEFGLFGVIILMFLVGVIFRKIYVSSRDTKNPLTMVTFAMAFGYIMQFICRGHFASWAIDIFFMFMPILFLNLILKYKYKSLRSLY